MQGTNITKSSVQRNLRKDIVEKYPAIEPYIDSVLPKKDDLFLTKCSNKITLISCDKAAKKDAAAESDYDLYGVPLFFQDGNGPMVPTLRLIHRRTTIIIGLFISANTRVVPVDIMPRVQVDKGAIKFILQGADVMTPGLLSEGASLPDNLQIGDHVIVYAEGKQHALAIGKMIMSSQEAKEKRSGHAIANLHCVCDGLWQLERVGVK